MSRHVRALAVIGVIAAALLASEHPALAAAAVGVAALTALVSRSMRRRRESPRPAAALPSPDRIGRILVPVDFSMESARALDFARALAGRFRSQVFVLYVVPPPRWPLGRSSPREAQETRWRARVAMQAFLRGIIGGTTGFQVVFATGTPFVAILDEARRLLVDLIVLGARGTGGAEEAVLGRTATEVVRRASVPVLTVAGPAAAASRVDDLAKAFAA